MIEQCRNCKFSFNYHDKNYECRRYPPTVTENESALNSTFPMVVSVERCGEYIAAHNSQKPENSGSGI